MPQMIKFMQGVTKRQHDWLTQQAGERGTDRQTEIRRLIDKAMEEEIRIRPAAQPIPPGAGIGG